MCLWFIYSTFHLLTTFLFSYDLWSGVSELSESDLNKMLPSSGKRSMHFFRMFLRVSKKQFGCVWRVCLCVFVCRISGRWIWYGGGCGVWSCCRSHRCNSRLLHLSEEETVFQSSDRSVKHCHHQRNTTALEIQILLHIPHLFHVFKLIHTAGSSLQVTWRAPNTRTKHRVNLRVRHSPVKKHNKNKKIQKKYRWLYIC